MPTKEVTRRVRIFLNAKEQKNDIATVQKEYRKLNNQVKRLDTTSKEYRQGVRKLRNLKSTIDSHNKRVRGVGRAWQNIKNAALGFVGGSLITSGLRAIGRALSSSLKKVVEFNQGQADLASILETNVKGIRELTRDSLRLGATTKFTATEVSKLQKEFAKLGFSEQEILNTTEATLNLAAATNTDLSEAAAVAGATVRGFGLDAEETGRVTDVMAKSFSSSALDIEKFKESMKTAAPIARAAGLDIEQTTAILGKLADAGISGSVAGTSLKKIFNELSKDGKPLAASLEDVRRRLAEAASPAERLGIAQELVGDRAQAALLILANQTTEIGQLENALDNAGGAAERMAETQLDTLGGDVTKLSSAWDGFVLSIENGEGPIGGAIREILQFATATLGLFTNTQTLSGALQEEQAELSVLVTSLRAAGNGTQRRADIIEEIQSQYPDFLGNLKDEEITNSFLSKRLEEVNNQYIAKIVLQTKEEEIQKRAELASKSLVVAYESEEKAIKLLESAEIKLFGAKQDTLDINDRISKAQSAARNDPNASDLASDERDNLLNEFNTSFFGEGATGTGVLTGSLTKRLVEDSKNDLAELGDELDALKEKLTEDLSVGEASASTVKNRGDLIREQNAGVTDAEIENAVELGKIQAAADEESLKKQQARADESARIRKRKAEKQAEDLKKLIADLDNIESQRVFDDSLTGLDEDSAAEQTEIRQAEEKFRALEELAGGNAEVLQRVEEEKQLAITRIQENYQIIREEKAEEAKDLLLERQKEIQQELEQLQLESLSGLERELGEVDLNEKNDLAESEETVNQRQLEAQNIAQTEEELQNLLADITLEGELRRTAIEKKANEDRQKITDDGKKAELDAEKAALLAKTQLISAGLNLLAEIAGEASAFGKAAALFDIGISSAVAIGNAVKSASALPFPGNLVAIASSIGVVTANIKKAKDILQQEKEPKVPTFHTGTDRFTTASGAKGELDVVNPRTGRVEARIEEGEAIIRKEAVNAQTRPIIRALNAGGFNSGSLPRINTTAISEGLTLDRTGVLDQVEAENITSRDSISTQVQQELNEIKQWRRELRVVLTQKESDDYAERQLQVKRVSEFS